MQLRWWCSATWGCPTCSYRTATRASRAPSGAWRERCSSSARSATTTLLARSSASTVSSPTSCAPSPANGATNGRTWPSAARRVRHQRRDSASSATPRSAPAKRPSTLIAASTPADLLTRRPARTRPPPPGPARPAGDSVGNCGGGPGRAEALSRARLRLGGGSAARRRRRLRPRPRIRLRLVPGTRPGPPPGTGVAESGPYLLLSDCRAGPDRAAWQPE